jgi:LPXTG-motif cell wall-anchored protein
MIEEFPAEPDDPKPPQTGDNATLGLWIGGAIISASAIIILLIMKKKARQ